MMGNDDYDEEEMEEDMEEEIEEVQSGDNDEDIEDE